MSKLEISFQDVNFVKKFEYFLHKVFEIDVHTTDGGNLSTYSLKKNNATRCLFQCTSSELPVFGQIYDGLQILFFQNKKN